MSKARQLTAEQTYRSCDSSQLEFATTAELSPLNLPLGQDRAREAIEFGIDIQQPGFNLFVIGPTGVGKRQLIDKVLKEHSDSPSPQYDWGYVGNFENPQQPRLLQLPAGLGQQLRSDLKQLVEDLLSAIPAAFQGEDYRGRRQEIENESRERYEQAFKQLNKTAAEKSVAVMRTPSGYTLAPIIDEEVITPEGFEKLPEQEQEKLKQDVETIQAQLQEVLRSMPVMTHEHMRQVKELNRQFTQSTVEQFIALLESKYQELPQVLEYLTEVKDDAIDNAEDFLSEDSGSDIEHIKQRIEEFHRYSINIVVDNTGLKTPPVVFEDNPTYQNLVGRVEYISQMGTLVTDFTLIKAGALQRAYGGYLVLEAEKLLSNIYAWEGLKRALKSAEVKITSLQQALSLESTLSLEPAPQPLKVKIILTGEPFIYYLLNRYDPELNQLFKVMADFSFRTERTAINSELYARMLATQQQQKQLRPLQAEAVARVIEQASRLAGDNEKLSLHLDGIDDLLTEADYWAGKSGAQHIERCHIETTLEKQRQRMNRVQEQLREGILRDISLIDTSGCVTAQVNGLSVLQLGDYAFGSPSRITATARLGSGKVVDIERETKLGGPLHSKGVLILGAYLANRYAQNRPLPLSASLVFEQNYGGVDGDSATVAELCALLSALADLPIKQSLAVTGSMNQHGQVQAIGGVNEKIEGFFEVCQARGLSGEHGVIIPASNSVHLMLHEDVRKAISQGLFSIYSVEHVDEVIALLCEMPSGEADAQGNYPKDSINARVQRRIEELQILQRQFAGHDKSDNGVKQDD